LHRARSRIKAQLLTITLTPLQVFHQTLQTEQQKNKDTTLRRQRKFAAQDESLGRSGQLRTHATGKEDTNEQITRLGAGRAKRRTDTVARAASRTRAETVAEQRAPVRVAK
jgi:hypothetical protein